MNPFALYKIRPVLFIHDKKNTKMIVQYLERCELSSGNCVSHVHGLRVRGVA